MWAWDRRVVPVPRSRVRSGVPNGRVRSARRIARHRGSYECLSCSHRACRLYSKCGLAVLRKAWLNLNLVWAAALVFTSLFTLLM
jgi:hypothetical protein